MPYCSTWPLPRLPRRPPEIHQGAKTSWWWCFYACLVRSSTTCCDEDPHRLFRICSPLQPPATKHHCFVFTRYAASFTFSFGFWSDALRYLLQEEVKALLPTGHQCCGLGSELLVGWLQVCGCGSDEEDTFLATTAHLQQDCLSFSGGWPQKAYNFSFGGSQNASIMCTPWGALRSFHCHWAWCWSLLPYFPWQRSTRRQQRFALFGTL